VIEAHPKQDVHFNLFSEGWEKREGARTGANG
jgi:galactonate dehydratase